MNTKFSFARVYTLLYYLIVLPFSTLFIFSLFLKYIFAGLGADEYFVFSTSSELFNYYFPQYFHIKSYLLCIPIFLLTTILLTPKHFNLKKFIVINITGIIFLTLYSIWAFHNTLSFWDKLANIANGMSNIKYEYSSGQFPDGGPGYQCVSFNIDPSNRIETQKLISERINKVDSSIKFHYQIGQQWIYDAKLLDTIKNDLRGSVCR